MQYLVQLVTPIAYQCFVHTMNFHDISDLTHFDWPSVPFPLSVPVMHTIWPREANKNATTTT